MHDSMGLPETAPEAANPDMLQALMMWLLGLQCVAGHSLGYHSSLSVAYDDLNEASNIDLLVNAEDAAGSCGGAQSPEGMQKAALSGMQTSCHHSHQYLHSGVRHGTQSPLLDNSLADNHLLTLQEREHEAHDKAREVQALQVGAPAVLLTSHVFTSRWCLTVVHGFRMSSNPGICTSHAMTSVSSICIQGLAR